MILYPVAFWEADMGYSYRSDLRRRGIKAIDGAAGLERVSGGWPRSGCAENDPIARAIRLSARRRSVRG